jgi:hypothetical protein
MPQLNWSPGALAAIPDKSQREQMTRLFNAYFRAAGEESQEALRSTILHLDLPTGTARPASRSGPAPPLGQPDKHRYHCYAKFGKETGWVVQAALKIEYRILSKGPGFQVLSSQSL